MSQNILNTHNLAELFDLPSWGDVIDINEDYISSFGQSAFERALEEGLSEKQADRAMIKAEQIPLQELHEQWSSAVENVVEYLLDKHNLVLQPKSKISFKIVPKTSWSDAAYQIMQTINGVGQFEFSSLREFLDSGPYSPKMAVLTNIRAILDYPEVYGTTSVKSMYDRFWR